MISKRARLASALCLALLGGCDYWRNLVEDHALSHGSISLRIQDAWTDSIMAGVVCRDTSDGLNWVSDAAGQILQGQMATGPYMLACSAPGYFDTSLALKVGTEGLRDSVLLTPKGGLDWYPGNLDVSVAVYRDTGISNFRVPGTLKLRATPANARSLLKYVWSFAKHPEFNRDLSSKNARSPKLQVSLSALDGEQQEDTVTLTVLAYLPGRQPYEVGTALLPITWSRNQHPSLQILSPPALMMYTGCGDLSFTVAYQADDSDGVCDSVTFDGEKPGSSTEGLHAHAECAPKSKYPVFQIQDRFAAMRQQGIDYVDSNRIRITAWDDNGQTSFAYFDFVMRPNKLPVVQLQKADSQTVHFAHRAVKFLVTAHDSDSQLGRLVVDWGDGNVTQQIPDLAVGSLSQKFNHFYASAGEYHPKATVYDGCDTAQQASQASSVGIIISADSPPAIDVQGNDYLSQSADSGVYSLHLSVQDPDIDTGLDSLRIYLDWGDGNSFTDSTHALQYYPGQNLSHTYKTVPPVSGFPLAISVSDGFGETAKYDIKVPPFK